VFSLSAKADYLVTGDEDLLELKSFRDTLIISPRDFESLFVDYRLIDPLQGPKEQVLNCFPSNMNSTELLLVLAQRLMQAPQLPILKKT
jgi:hypothetical protein